QIELADVTFGNLPLTGGYLPWLWAFGISLVLASAAVMWNRRREWKKYTAPSGRASPLGGCWLPGGGLWFGKDSSAPASTLGNRG
ncbi:MAG: hypothetical protein ACLR7M_04070, partial [Varibaculum timonense]